jgi:signal transduction histidine kinase
MRKHGGSGLGLAIVHQLCKAMKGTVVVNSVPGEGSVFTVTLPLEIMQDESAQNA